LFVVQIDWYGPILKYRQKGYFENDIPKEERSRIDIKYKPYSLYEGQLYKLGSDNILQQCLTFEEMVKVLANFHEGLVGGHFGINNIVRKVLASSY
jgi:ASC-1-like (ASCH) protein